MDIVETDPTCWVEPGDAVPASCTHPLPNSAHAVNQIAIAHGYAGCSRASDMMASQGFIQYINPTQNTASTCGFWDGGVAFDPFLNKGSQGRMVCPCSDENTPAVVEPGVGVWDRTDGLRRLSEDPIIEYQVSGGALTDPYYTFVPSLPSYFLPGSTYKFNYANIKSCYVGVVDGGYQMGTARGDVPTWIVNSLSSRHGKFGGVYTVTIPSDYVGNVSYYCPATQMANGVIAGGSMIKSIPVLIPPPSSPPPLPPPPSPPSNGRWSLAEFGKSCKQYCLSEHGVDIVATDPTCWVLPGDTVPVGCTHPLLNSAHAVNQVAIAHGYAGCSTYLDMMAFQGFIQYLNPTINTFSTCGFWNGGGPFKPLLNKGSQGRMICPCSDENTPAPVEPDVGICSLDNCGACFRSWASSSHRPCARAQTYGCMSNNGDGYCGCEPWQTENTPSNYMKVGGSLVCPALSTPTPTGSSTTSRLPLPPPSPPPAPPPPFLPPFLPPPSTPSPPSTPLTQFYVTRHINYGNNGVQGWVFDSEAEAIASFNSYVNKNKAVAMWDAQLTELRYYGNRGARLGLGIGRP